MPNIELLNCDCMEVMKGYPDKYFDLAIVDPPYGIGRDGSVKTTSKHGGRKAHTFKGWDNETPTQKPIVLYSWLLHNYAKEGDKILDTHGGSRSLAIACYKMGFDHVSCEIDIDYHNDSVKRYNNSIMQQSLFKP